MDYQVVLSPASLASLAEITAWIAKDDPVAAERIGNELLNRIAILGKFPRVGSLYAPRPPW